MYRKFTVSTKCTRNERLAQLSEQENVIERKKKEILAKIEAKKKKETEEALKKFEPTSAYTNESPASKSNICPREKDAEDEEITSQTPRNAFSNDGSFLDQFKKLSRSGLGSTTSVKGKEEEELSNTKQECFEREETKKLMQNNQFRYHSSDDRKKDRKNIDRHFSTRNPEDFNIQNQFSHQGMNYSVREHISAAAAKFKSGESVDKVNASFPISASSSLVKPGGFGRKLQNQEPDKRTENDNHLVESGKNKSMRKKFWNYNEIQSPSLYSIPSSERYSSLGADGSNRISPAFTHEVDNCVTSENGNSSKSFRHGEETLGTSTTTLGTESKRLLSEENNDRATTLSYLNLDKLQDIASLPRTSDNPGSNAERNEKRRNSECDSSDSDSNSKDPCRSDNKTSHNIHHSLMDKTGDGYQADCEDGLSYNKTTDQRQKKVLFYKAAVENLSKCNEIPDESKGNENFEAADVLTSGETRKRRKKSRWGEEVVPASVPNAGTNLAVQHPLTTSPVICTSMGKTPMLSKLTRSDPGLIQYAKQTFGSTNLSEEDWKKAEDHYKVNLLYQDMVKKRAEIERLEKAGKFKYEYDSDEDVEGGTWEHKLRQQEMLATQLWAEELTRQAAGKHHIGDFLPPEELERFMERYNAVKQGRKPDLSDYKEFKLKEDNVGYRLLQKMGWNEGQGLGQDGSGITNPVNKATTRAENQGLGIERPDGLEAGDDEYDAYRKRMMLAYRFRPNPLNNPRRPYY